MFEFNFEKVSGKSFEPHPEGVFSGVIEDIKEKKTQAGHKVLSVTYKTEHGKLFDMLNLEHPNSVEKARQKITELLCYGYNNPPTKLATVSDVMLALIGLPVVLNVKHQDTLDQKGNVKYYINPRKVHQDHKKTFGEVKASTESKW